MSLSSRRLTRARAAIAGCLVLAVPLAARTLFASAGPETVIAQPVVTPLGNQPLAVGTDGTNFAIFDGQAGLHAQRVSPAGALLDPVEVAIPYSPGNGSVGIASAPSANGYLIAYGGDRQLLIQHLRSDLSAVEAAPVKVADLPASANIPVALARGADGGYLLVWEESPLIFGITDAVRAIHLDATGQPTGAPITLLASNRTGAMLGPSVAFGGGVYEVVWSDGTTLQACRVSTAGASLDAAPTTIATTTTYGSPILVAGASRFVVAWNDTRADAGSTGAFYAARIGFDGIVADAEGVQVVGGARFGSLAYSTSTGLAASWVPAGSITRLVGRLSESDLSLSPSAGTALPNSNTDAYALLASNGSVTLAAFEVVGATGVTPLSSLGAPSLNPPTQLGSAPGKNGVAHLGSSGSGYLAAWSVVNATGSAYSTEIWARAMASDGTPLAGAVKIPTQFPNFYPAGLGEPSVVWTGTEYMVIWVVPNSNDPMGPYFVRVKQDGTVLDVAPQTTLDQSISPKSAVTYVGGGGHLFALTTGAEVTVKRFDESGFPAPAAPTNIWFTSSEVAAGWIDSGHLQLAFITPSDFGGSEVFASVLDVNAMTTTNPVSVFKQSWDPVTGPIVVRGQYETAIAVRNSKDGAFLVAGVDTNGALIEAATSTSSPATASGVSLAWNGARYVLAWGDVGSSTSQVGYASDLGSADGGARFGLTGALQPFAESIASPGPALASMGNGTSLLVATRALAGDTSVVGVKWTSDPPLGPPQPLPNDAGADASDSGPIGDASANDASADAGIDANVDAAVPSDAGSDAAHVADAGHAMDGSAPFDAAAGADSSVNTGGDDTSSGCSCRAGSSGTSPSPAWAALIVALAVARRRRGRAEVRV